MSSIPTKTDPPELDETLTTCAEEPFGLRSFLLRTLPADLLWCFSVGVVLTLVLTPFFSGGRSVWLQSFVFNTVISLGIGFSVAYAYRFLLPPLRRRFPGRVASVVSHVILAVAATAFGVELAVRALDAVGGMRASQIRADVLRIGLVVVAIIVGMQVVYDRLRRKARQDELRAQQAKKAALRAELRALQARTNPHFLFNCLNTVAGLIEESPGDAEAVLERLADLFRYTLKGTEVSWVRLSEEVEAVQSYLEVETIRLGERLRTEIQVAADVKDVLVPPLLLQPLVENAVLHGVAPRRSGGRVAVDAARRNGSLVLSVRDDGDGPGSSPHRGSGTSLSELDQRLTILYDGAASFDTSTGENGGFAVTLTLPLEAPA